MQTRTFRRVLRALLLPAVLVPLLASCADPNDPYAKLKDAPLTKAHLHTVTVAGEDMAFPGELQVAGYRFVKFPPNYPAADEVQGVLWDVPPAVVKEAHMYRADGKEPDVRYLVQRLPAAAPPANPDYVRSFFRHVLGTDVPELPEGVKLTVRSRVLVWSYQVPSIIDVRRKLRENVLPVVTEPVGITTPYLGDQKSMSLRAPDGTIVELVESAER